MDPVSLVVGALAAGAAKGIGEAAASAVKDTYAELKQRVRSRFGGREDLELALEQHEADPATWHAPLVKAVTETEAAADKSILATAQQLMELVDPAGAAQGKYVVDARGSQGVQIGDGNIQSNVFGTPPER